MLRRLPVIALLLSLPATFAGEEPTATADLDPSEVELAISLDKEVYVPGELVRVTSTLRIVGKRTLRVRRPHTVQEAVLHHVDRIVDGKRERAAFPQACRSAVGWGPIVVLKPGESVSNTCELPHGSTMLWSADEPGRYVLQSNYPTGKTGDVHLDGGVTYSNEVTFRVRTSTKAEQRERDELLTAWKSVYNPTTREYDGDPAPVRTWLRNHPKSLHRHAAYQMLQIAHWAAEDYRGCADLMREEREAGILNNWSAEWRDKYLTAEVSLLKNQGRLDEAVDALAGSENPEHVRWSERLLERAKAR